MLPREVQSGFQVVAVAAVPHYFLNLPSSNAAAVPFCETRLHPENQTCAAGKSDWI
jgi:hypothetical protein